MTITKQEKVRDGVEKKLRNRSRRRTPWDEKEERTPMQEFLYQQYKDHYERCHPALTETGEADLINSFIPEVCPYCLGKGFKRYGKTHNGVQRYQCQLCGQTFSPITKTIFDGHKISISEWIDYILNILRYVSISADSWNNRNAITTSRYWLEKLFLVLEEYQKGIQLSGRIWFDETYYQVRNEDIAYTPSGEQLRGLSSNQMCIGVACDENNILCIYEGFGKPSQKKTHLAFKDHIIKGSALVHDKDNAHKKLIVELELDDESYDSRTLKKLADIDNPLNRVNRIHALLKVFLNAHNSFDRNKLQGYLDLFTFAMNPPTNNLQKVEILLNLAFHTPKSLKYRDFYHANQ